MMRRILISALMAVGMVVGVASPAFAVGGLDSYAPSAEEVWAGTSVETAGTECWQDAVAKRVYCVQKAGAGPTVEACFGQFFEPCYGRDYATTENLQCAPWPPAMHRDGAGFELCVNSAPMKAFLDSSAADVPRVGIDFKCGVFDEVCKFQQSLADGTTSWAVGNIDEAMKSTAFTSDGSLWVGAATEFSWWRWAVVLVTVLAMAWGITFGLLKQDGPMIRGAVVGGILAWPMAEVAVWGLGHLLDVSELLTQSVLGAGSGGSFASVIADLANNGTFEDRTAVVWSSLILAAGSIVLFFVFSFRNLALMVLIAFAPLAFMLAPTRPGVRVITVWASAVLALLITKPLTMGLLSLILTTGQELDSLWAPEAIPLLLGIILTLFMPLVAFSLFDFVGTQAVSAAEGAGRTMAGAAARPMQNAGYQAGNALRSMGNRATRGARAGGASPRPVTPGAGVPKTGVSVSKPPATSSGGGAGAPNPVTPVPPVPTKSGV